MKKTFKSKYGSWAVVAGAAEGLGESFTRMLAGKGMHVVMVDMNSDAVEDLAAKIKHEYGVECITLHLDLASPDAHKRVMDSLRHLDCRLLVYNAAYSRVESFLSQSIDSLDQYIDVNCRTLLKLIHGFTGNLIRQQKGGGVIIMSSLAGLIGSRYVAPYAATKAFGALLAESLSHELAYHRIDIMACLAGATGTPAFFRSSPRLGRFSPGIADPDFVAHKALDHLGHHVLYIPGRFNKISYFVLTRFLPRSVASSLVNRMIGNMYVDLK